MFEVQFLKHSPLYPCIASPSHILAPVVWFNAKLPRSRDGAGILWERTKRFGDGCVVGWIENRLREVAGVVPLLH